LLSCLEEHDIFPCLLPQTAMNTAVNKPLKCTLENNLSRKQFEEWYANEVAKQGKDL